MEVSTGLRGRRYKLELSGGGGKSLIHSRKQNSLVATSSCLNRNQKIPVKIQVNLNKNIFPVKIDSFERTFAELCSGDERGIGSVHEIKNLKTRFESLMNERQSPLGVPNVLTQSEVVGKDLKDTIDETCTKFHRQ